MVSAPFLACARAASNVCWSAFSLAAASNQMHSDALKMRAFSFATASAARAASASAALCFSAFFRFLLSLSRSARASPTCGETHGRRGEHVAYRA